MEGIVSLTSIREGSPGFLILCISPAGRGDSSRNQRANQGTNRETNREHNTTNRPKTNKAATHTKVTTPETNPSKAIP